MNARPMLMLAVMLAARSAAAQSPRSVTLEKHDTKATITALPQEPDVASPAMQVSLTSASATKDWDYQRYLDAESTGAPQAEILPLGGREYLFVRAYSGGAHCCWSLLVFDLHALRALGEQVRSQSPIQLVEHRHGCALGALALPPDRHELGEPRARSTLYCFDGKQFSERRARVPMPFAARKTDARAGAQCLRYGPEEAELVGTLSRRTFPGPPDYESVRKGDAPENCWLLHLSRPVCVEPADPSDPTQVVETDVTVLQVILPRGARPAAGTKVRIKGTLTHSTTGHHHTKVLVDATELTRAR